MGAAHGEPCAAAAARRERLRVIHAACAEAPCAQRRGRTAKDVPREPALKMAKYILSVCLRGILSGDKVKRKFPLLVGNQCHT